MARQASQNCINCAMGDVFMFTHFMGMSRKVLICNHENNATIPPRKQTFFKLDKVPAILSLIVISFSHYYGALATIKAIKSKVELVDLLLPTSDLIIYEIATLIIIHSLIRFPKMDRALLHLDTVIRNFQAFTSHSLLPINVVIDFRARTYVGLTVLCGYFCIASVAIFCLEIEPRWNIIEKVGISIALHSLVSIICSAALFVRVFYSVYNQFVRYLRMDLENLLFDTTTLALTNENDITVSMPPENVKDLLKVYAETYISLVKVLKHFNDACNPIMLILLILGSIFFVVSWFLVVLVVAYKTPVGIRFISLEIGLQVAMFGTGFIIVRFGKSSAFKKEILSLLQKFQMSILEPAEQLQFQCFLYVVEKYPTYLEASGILRVDIQLFGNMLSTVLTYVLVAVQFEFLEPTVLHF